MGSKPVKIFVLAGEASGDLIGARFMHACKKVYSNAHITFIGVGGERMESEGLKPIFPMSDLSIMGLFEVILHLPKLLRRINECANLIRHEKPDVIVTIDAPDFSFRLAKKILGLNIPHLHFVAPTVWAWRPGRAKKITKLIDHLLAFYPFEPPYFTKEELDCTFIGHPLTELGIGKIDRMSFRHNYNVSDNVPLVCVLPGSRQNEISKLLPIYVEAVKRLKTIYPSLKLVIPTVPHLHNQVMTAFEQTGVPTIYITNEEEKYAAMRSSNAALATSGTVNLELALAGTPFIITYRMNPLTAWLARRILTVDYVCMSNILLNEGLIPELLQGDCTPDQIVTNLQYLLNNKSAQTKQRAGLKKVAGMLANQSSPSVVAANIALKLSNLTPRERSTRSGR